MVSKKLKRLFNLIALSFITVSIGICGCKAASLSESIDAPETEEAAVLPELPEVQEPSYSAPEPVTPPVNSQVPSGSASTQAEVAAEYEFTPISETECSVACTNKGEVIYAEIPRNATIAGKEYTVTEIAEGAFCYSEEGGIVGRSRLKTVTLPTTVKKIGFGAFEWCFQLTDVNGLSYVEEIENVAFLECKSLKQAYLSSAVKIGEQTFLECESLESVYLYKATSIGLDAFYGCTKLREIVIPQSVETMGYMVFGGNNTQVKIAKGTNTEKWRKDWNERNENQNVIYNYEVPAEFEFTPINDTECNVNCINKKIAVVADIPETAVIDGKQYTVTEIAPNCFMYGEFLEKASLPSSVRKINYDSFYGCSSLYKASFSGVKEISGGAFENCRKLSEIDLSCVEVLDDSRVFCGCSSLTSVNLSSAVKIGGAAFQNCKNLESVTLSVAEEIGNIAFEGCTKLSEIVIPESVAVMGKSVFDFNDTQIKAVAQSKPEGWDVTWNGDKNNPNALINKNQNVIWGWFEGKAVLEYTAISETECSVTCANIYTDVVTFAEVPETAIIDGKEYTVTELGPDCFYYAFKLEKVVLPDTIISVKELAFATCELITEISLPNAKYIRNSAFAECAGLTSISLPKALCIEYCAFDGCTGLQSVEIPSVQWLEFYAFSDCFSLKEIVLPKSLTTVWGSVFDGNDTKVKVVKGTDTSKWDEDWNKDNKNQDVDYFYLLPAKFEFRPVSDTECRVDCTNKEEAMQADIPATAIIDGKTYYVTDISRTFSECTTLEKAILPYTVTKIGDRAFYGCENLNEISTVSVTEIGIQAFAFCSLVDELIISGVTKIDNFAFQRCENLTGVEISDVTEIGKGVFHSCRNLESVQLSRVDKIDDAAFSNCTSLTYVSLNGVKEIGICAFQSTGLESIVIPDTVQTMGSRVFENTDTQVKVVAQSKPEGWDVQWNRNNANQNVIWGWFEGKAVFGYTPIEGTENCAVYCLNKEEVIYAEIPSTAIIDGNVCTVTKIADNAFSGSSKLQTVILPYTVTDIGDNAFAGCEQLEETVISAKVLTMGETVFNGCTAKVYVYADEKPDGWADNWNGDDDNIVWGWKDEAGRLAYTVISETECEVSLINKLTAVEARIPAKVIIDGKEYSVTAIADGGFKGSALLKKVVVPYTLKYIGEYAFADCFELENFSLYNTQTIEKSAFENCKSLERLFVPKSVSFIGDNILSGTVTAVFVRASSDEGWAQNWNFGNGGEVEFDSKLLLPIEI